MALELNGTTGVSLVQDGVVTAADLNSTLDLSGKTVTLPSDVAGINQGWKLLDSIDSGVNTDYGSGVEILDWSAEADNYDQFYFYMNAFNDSQGRLTGYFEFTSTSGGTKLSFNATQYAYGSNSSTNTNANNNVTYVKFCEDLADDNAVNISGFISNPSSKTAGSRDQHVFWNVSWEKHGAGVYSGHGAAINRHGTDYMKQMIINTDNVSGSNETLRVTAAIYGVR